MKRPFEIDVAIARLREAVRPFPRAMLFQLYADGHTSPFEMLVACLISVRTRDEISLAMARQLQRNAVKGSVDHCAFHEAKAQQIREIARRAVADHNGEVPCDSTSLQSFSGVGPKCANLVLGIACGQPRIGVDTRVHRVTNRWGYVSTRNPDATLATLQTKLPREYRVEINGLLVPFGKNICTPMAPKCSTCPLLSMCEQRGVDSHR